jgi:fructokinase
MAKCWSIFLPSSVNNPSYIPLAGGAPANTALVLVSLDPCDERTFSFYRHNSADMQYGISQVDKINWQNIGFFHFCSNTLTSQPIYSDTLYAIASAKKNNVLISFDVNLRQQLWQDLSVFMYRVEACIAESDIIKLSKDEAEYLANIKQVDVESYINYILTLGAKLIVITDGPNAIQVTCNSFTVLVAVPKIFPIDTAGEGDSFISGFFSLAQSVEENENINTLFDLIEQRELIFAAVLFGSKCGAFTCQK